MEAALIYYFLTNEKSTGYPAFFILLNNMKVLFMDNEKTMSKLYNRITLIFTTIKYIENDSINISQRIRLKKLSSANFEKDASRKLEPLVTGDNIRLLYDYWCNVAKIYSAYCYKERENLIALYNALMKRSTRSNGHLSTLIYKTLAQYSLYFYIKAFNEEGEITTEYYRHLTVFYDDLCDCVDILGTYKSSSLAIEHSYKLLSHLFVDFLTSLNKELHMRNMLIISSNVASRYYSNSVNPCASSKKELRQLVIHPEHYYRDTTLHNITCH